MSKPDDKILDSFISQLNKDNVKKFNKNARDSKFI
jgi:hypothetical protein